MSSSGRKTGRQNIRKRGGTYTYYVYGIGPDGARKQFSQVECRVVV